MRFGFIGAGNMASAIIRGMTIGTKSYEAGRDLRCNCGDNGGGGCSGE